MTASQGGRGAGTRRNQGSKQDRYGLGWGDLRYEGSTGGGRTTGRPFIFLAHEYRFHGLRILSRPANAKISRIETTVFSGVMQHDRDMQHRRISYVLMRLH